MSEDRKKILEMLAAGTIDVEAAERLLTALGDNRDSKTAVGSGKRPKYLRVTVEPSTDNPGGDRVNIRVPINLIRAGMKWVTLIPNDAQSKVMKALKEKDMDVDFARMTPQDLDDFIHNLNELEVDVEGKDTVRVYCE